MKAYKIELLIIDHDYLEEDEIGLVLETANYPNDCISPHVMSTQGIEIGDWADEHPLNSTVTMKNEFKRLFKN